MDNSRIGSRLVNGNRRIGRWCMVVAGSAVVAGVMPQADAAPTAPISYRQTAVVHIPAPHGALYGDIIFADADTGRVYFSDLANSTVDVIDGRSNRLLAQVPGFTNGPNGVLVDGLGQIWAGDGAGAVRVLDARRPYRLVDAVPVGTATADELAYDPKDKIVAVTSPDAVSAADPTRPTPWVTLVDARPGAGGRHRILGRALIPGATAGSIEQPQWDPRTSTFVEAVGATVDFPHGVVVRIDPREARVTSVLPISGNCSPRGLAVGVHHEALLGCVDGGPALMDLSTGEIVARYDNTGACCADEVWFNSADGRYYAAEAGATGPPPAPTLAPPAVMVIDARSRHFVTDIALGPDAGGFHQVSSLFRWAKVFVPEPDGLHIYSRVPTPGSPTRSAPRFRPVNSTRKSELGDTS